MLAAILYFIAINAAAFVLMGVDKARARRGDSKRRIPERRLLGFGAAGGALGAMAAMRLFRHKTKHASFAIGLPLMFVVHAAAIYVLLMVLN
ncbi:DUF1294 domain-containing protein [Paenibacillus humicola]|uniref:DUF1294 domain-containing protein n=1 Tax=Paenibacillus humicola TaxID=3110540 RepID=UPI00237A9831|nr:DUF1294 domain-containing protein [Paenibacillus humicola]